MFELMSTAKEVQIAAISQTMEETSNWRMEKCSAKWQRDSGPAHPHFTQGRMADFKVI